MRPNPKNEYKLCTILRVCIITMLSKSMVKSVVFITNSAYIVRDYLELLANFDHLFGQNHL
jgi:hypothetical protein